MAPRPRCRIGRRGWFAASVGGGGQHGGEPDEEAVRRIIARATVAGGLMLALSTCSTRPIDIICPPAGQCPNTASGHGGGY